MMFHAALKYVEVPHEGLMGQQYCNSQLPSACLLVVSSRCLTAIVADCGLQARPDSES